MLQTIFPPRAPRDRKSLKDVVKAHPLMRRFADDERGTILIFTIMLFIVMLAIGGMAVDFMRFESRRSLLQSVADRSVLAGANLDQKLPADVVVRDYFAKSGFADAIVGSPDVAARGGTRSVGVNAELDLNTFYLRYLGIPELSAPAASRAIEGTGDIEISLVLDISGSMGSRGGSTGKTRMQLLHEAGVKFVNLLLKPEYKDQISISLVTYSTQVSVGPEIFNALNLPRVTMVDEATGQSFTNPSHCVDIPQAEFTKAEFNPTAAYRQVETFQSRRARRRVDGSRERNPELDQPVCPIFTNEGILPFTQNASVLNARIESLRPRQFTSIYNGVKWGTTMLDPGIRDAMATVSTVDPAFAGLRPADFGDGSQALETQKYLVLMTDGKNESGFRVDPDAYDTVQERIRWANYNVPAWVKLEPKDFDDTKPAKFDADDVQIKNPIDEPLGDTLTRNICQAAKDRGIIIYTIALGVTNPILPDCASSADRYYQTDGGELGEIFESIAVQITNLRLTL